MKNFWKKMLTASIVTGTFAAVTAISASAALTVVDEPAHGCSSDNGIWLVRLYSEGDTDYAPIDYGVEYDLIKNVKLTVKLEETEGFEGNFGGAVVISSSATDHNWPIKSFWGLKDDALGIDSVDNGQALVFEKTADATYTVVCPVDESNYFIEEGAAALQIAFQEWGGSTNNFTVLSVDCLDENGNSVISFDGKGTPTVAKTDEIVRSDYNTWDSGLSYDEETGRLSFNKYTGDEAEAYYYAVYVDGENRATKLNVFSTRIAEEETSFDYAIKTHFTMLRMRDGYFPTGNVDIEVLVFEDNGGNIGEEEYAPEKAVAVSSEVLTIGYDGYKTVDTMSAPTGLTVTFEDGMPSCDYTDSNENTCLNMYKVYNLGKYYYAIYPHNTCLNNYGITKISVCSVDAFGNISEFSEPFIITGEKLAYTHDYDDASYWMGVETSEYSNSGLKCEAAGNFMRNAIPFSEFKAAYESFTVSNFRIFNCTNANLNTDDFELYMFMLGGTSENDYSIWYEKAGSVLNVSELDLNDTDYVHNVGFQIRLKDEAILRAGLKVNDGFYINDIYITEELDYFTYNYDGSAITMLMSEYNNGGSGLSCDYNTPVSISNVTYGTDTFGTIKEKYKGVLVNNLKVNNCSLDIPPEDFDVNIYIWHGESIENTSWTTVSGNYMNFSDLIIGDNEVIFGIGYQIWLDDEGITKYGLTLDSEVVINYWLPEFEYNEETGNLSFNSYPGALSYTMFAGSYPYTCYIYSESGRISTFPLNDIAFSNKSNELSGRMENIIEGDVKISVHPYSDSEIINSETYSLTVPEYKASDIVSAPSDVSFDSETETISWSEVSGAIRYAVAVFEDGNNIIFSGLGKTEYCLPSDKLSAGTYTAKIFAMDSNYSYGEATSLEFTIESSGIVPPEDEPVYEDVELTDEFTLVYSETGTHTFVQGSTPGEAEAAISVLNSSAIGGIRFNQSDIVKVTINPKDDNSHCIAFNGCNSNWNGWNSINSEFTTGEITYMNNIRNVMTANDIVIIEDFGAIYIDVYGISIGDVTDYKIEIYSKVYYDENGALCWAEKENAEHYLIKVKNLEGNYSCTSDNNSFSDFDKLFKENSLPEGTYALAIYSVRETAEGTEEAYIGEKDYFYSDGTNVDEDGYYVLDFGYAETEIGIEKAMNGSGLVANTTIEKKIPALTYNGMTIGDLKRTYNGIKVENYGAKNCNHPGVSPEDVGVNVYVFYGKYSTDWSGWLLIPGNTVDFSELDLDDDWILHGIGYQLIVGSEIINETDLVEGDVIVINDPDIVTAVPPENVKAEADDISITITWDEVSGATKYRVQRSEEGGSWKTITYPTKTSYIDSDIVPGVTYSYRVLAYVSGKWSNPSEAVSAMVEINIVPENLKAVAGDSKVTLTWDAVEGATKYRVQRHNGSAWATISYPATNTYVDTGLTNDTTYKYRVLAYAGDKWSTPSEPVSATPEAMNIPQNLKAVAGDSKVTLSWDAVDGATKYRVQRN
ncbi:MAG: fibronectin type III domain-containing protein, partial [Ruminiclostridium sp.]|nr:fibronectin type III domain-containing protein [Ruminiclostridium sp.]